MTRTAIARAERRARERAERRERALAALALLLLLLAFGLAGRIDYEDAARVAEGAAAGDPTCQAVDPW